ncbi:hypothetical protein [Pseudoxanthomonas mexicana]|uniref:hypothetical protein n=1 Tax=Pseudoxanthomonas mexicana TaxID=128785 RepID=UPI00398AB0A5
MRPGKPVLGFVVLLAAAAALLFLSRNEAGKAPPSSPVEMTAMNAEDTARRHDAIDPVQTAAMRASSPRDSSPRIGDPLSGARTDAELAWLRRNGYPSNEAAQQAASQRGIGVRLDRSRALDPSTILDAEQLALLEPERRQEALEFLSESARMGSIYALEALSRSYQGGGSPDPVRAAAYLKASELRGNWPAGAMQGMIELTPQQRMYATLMAHQIIRDMQLARARAGLPPLGIDTRPGLDALIREIQAQAAPGTR